MEIEYIPIDKCIDGHVYRIRARNGRIGIYRESDRSFIISRHKYQLHFVDYEEHWDCGEPHGTVKPLEHLGEAPEFKNDKEILDYLEELTKTVKGIEYPEFEK